MKKSKHIHLVANLERLIKVYAGKLYLTIGDVVSNDSNECITRIRNLGNQPFIIEAPEFKMVANKVNANVFEANYNLEPMFKKYGIKGVSK